MISSATQVPQGSTMAALSCLHWGGGLRSLPRYLTYNKRAIPGARRVDDGAGVDSGTRGEPRSVPPARR